VGLLNVRLDREDERRVDELRKTGVQLSQIVRAAIRAEHAQRVRKRTRTPPSSVVKEILASLPDPSAADASRKRPVDRHAIKRRIAAKLKRKRP